MTPSTGKIEYESDVEDPRRSQRLILALCIAAYVILAIAVFWPAPPWDGSRLPSTRINLLGPHQYGSGDPAQMTWFLAWVPYAIRHGLSIFHTGFLDYPVGVNLANNTSAPLLGLLAAPVTVLLGPIAAFNMLLRLAFASSAASMFLVLKNWCRWPAAFVGGLAYGFGPYIVTQGQTHLNLAFVPLPPLIVWCLYELLFEQRRRPMRVGVLLGLLAGAQVLISPEIFALLAMVVGLGLVGLTVRSRGDLRGQFGHLVRAAGPALAVFFILDGWYFWCLLIAPGHLVGTVQPVYILQSYRADLLGPIIPTMNEVLTLFHLGHWSERYLDGNFSENTTYVGVPIVLLFGYFSVRWRRDRRLVFSAILALAAFVLSLGSPLSINGHLTWIPMPEFIFVHIPILDDIVPARLSIVVWLFAVIVLAPGADRTVHSLMDRRPYGRVFTAGPVATALSLLLAIAFVVPRLPFKTETSRYPVDTKSALNVIPPGSVVLTYPYATSSDTEAMIWQAEDAMRFRIIGGYATVQAGFDGLSVAPGYPNYGAEQQPLLALPFIQEYLDARQNSPEDRIYAKPAANIEPHHALCRFITAYRVGAVIFWNDGGDSDEVKQLFLKDLGIPTRATDDKKLLVWLTTPGRCHA